MSGLFFQLGRKLGRVAVPLARKSKWVWASLTGSPEEALRAETDLGRALAAELRVGLGGAAVARDKAFLAAIGQRLAAQVRSKARAFHVEPMQSGQPTAVALPGGFIFVDTALLDLGERQEDELAFVVGHEMGHVIGQHALDRLVARVGTDALAALLGRSALGPWLRQRGLALLQSAYSRDHELEADAVGARLARAAGYDPAGAFRWLERLSRCRSAMELVGDYFAAHPPEAERLAHLKSVLPLSSDEAAID